MRRGARPRHGALWTRVLWMGRWVCVAGTAHVVMSRHGDRGDTGYILGQGSWSSDKVCSQSNYVSQELVPGFQDLEWTHPLRTSAGTTRSGRTARDTGQASPCTLPQAPSLPVVGGPGRPPAPRDAVSPAVSLPRWLGCCRPTSLVLSSVPSKPVCRPLVDLGSFPRTERGGGPNDLAVAGVGTPGNGGRPAPKGARPSAQVHLKSEPLPPSLERTPLRGRHLASLDGGLEAGPGPGGGVCEGKTLLGSRGPGF